MPERRFAPAAARNAEPILAVLRRELPGAGVVLEVAAGTGQHAATFAPALGDLQWQPTDRDPSACRSIDAWARDAGASNVRPARVLDVTDPLWPIETAAALLAVNLLHIAPIEATWGLLAGAARVVQPGGPLVIYGPFSRGGEHTAPSNAAFDRQLRGQDPAWGVRDLDVVARRAAAIGVPLATVVSMPANNLIAVFRAR